MCGTVGIWLILVSLLIGCTWCFLLEQTWRCPARIRHTSHVIPHEEHCYEFKLDTKKYWDEAYHDCESRDGHLVVIKDNATQTFLMTSLRSLGYRGKRIWIGLTDKKKEYDWRWVTGDRLDGYTHWKPGQGYGALHLIQDCAYMDFLHDGLWHDMQCHLWPEHYQYICQYDMLPSTTTQRTTTTTSTTTTTTTTATTPTPTTTTTTEHTPTTTVGCHQIDCGQICPNGYTGLNVGFDGCISCMCS